MYREERPTPMVQRLEKVNSEYKSHSRGPKHIPLRLVLQQIPQERAELPLGVFVSYGSAKDGYHATNSNKSYCNR